MATRSMSLLAPSSQDLETMTMSYIAQGFSVANKTPMQVTLVKRKEFSILWAVVGFIVCVLPLLIYLLVYALESDQMVTITVAGAQQPAVAGQFPGTQPLSPSGTLYTPQPANYMNAPRSPDGLYWWDGQSWRLIPQGAATNPGYQQPQTGPMDQQPPSNPTGPMSY